MEETGETEAGFYLGDGVQAMLTNCVAELSPFSCDGFLIATDGELPPATEDDQA